MSKPLRVAVFYDQEGWAWWHRARQIAANVSGAVSVSVFQCGQDFDRAGFDLALTFGWYKLEDIDPMPRERVIVGCSCPLHAVKTLGIVRSGGYGAMLVNSLEMARMLVNQPDVFCCQNGVDTGLFTPGPGRGSPETACWVGNSRSIGEKGLDIIREACARAGFALAHHDVEASEATRSKVMSQEQLRDNVYRQADFYLCASKAEGTPNTALEALACGLPVITTPVGNMPEIIRDGVNGYLARRDPASLAEAMGRLREADYTAMRERARRSVLDGWSWRDAAARYEAMFLALASRLPERASNGEDAA
ncbi:MAG: glycosyltransferase [Thermodesulfobacteriota bacterium]